VCDRKTIGVRPSAPGLDIRRNGDDSVWALTALGPSRPVRISQGKLKELVSALSRLALGNSVQRGSDVAVGRDSLIITVLLGIGASSSLRCSDEKDVSNVRPRIENCLRNHVSKLTLHVFREVAVLLQCVEGILNTLQRVSTLVGRGYRFGRQYAA